MDLFLRKVIHPQAHDNYRVVLLDDGDEIEIGSIGVQGWHWGVDTAIPMRSLEAEAPARTVRTA
jgi:hypothetical protein